MASQKASKEKQKKRRNSPARQQNGTNAISHANYSAYHASPSHSTSDPRLQAMFSPERLQDRMLVRAQTFHSHPGNAGQYPFTGPGEYLPRRDTDPNILAHDLAEAHVRRLERIAALPARKGNTYGTLKVAKNARAVRGNCFYGNNLEAQLVARSHKYGNAEVEDEAGLIDGDLPGEELDNFFSGRTDATHYGEAGQA